MTVLEKIRKKLGDHQVKIISDYDQVILDLADGKDIPADEIEAIRNTAGQTSGALDRAVEAIIARREAVERLSSAANSLGVRQAKYTAEYATLDQRCRDIVDTARREERKVRMECRVMHDAIRESRDAIEEMWTHAPADVKARHAELTDDNDDTAAKALYNNWFNEK